MKKIVIFAGTTEGRRLSEILADAGIAHTVCVATDYGAIVMRDQTDAEAAGTKGQPRVSLHRGRMDRQLGKTECPLLCLHPQGEQASHQDDY